MRSYLYEEWVKVLPYLHQEQATEQDSLGQIATQVLDQGMILPVLRMGQGVTYLHLVLATQQDSLGQIAALVLDRGKVVRQCHKV